MRERVARCVWARDGFNASCASAAAQARAKRATLDEQQRLEARIEAIAADAQARGEENPLLAAAGELTRTTDTERVVVRFGAAAGAAASEAADDDESGDGGGDGSDGGGGGGGGGGSAAAAPVAPAERRGPVLAAFDDTAGGGGGGGGGGSGGGAMTGVKRPRASALDDIIAAEEAAKVRLALPSAIAARCHRAVGAGSARGGG